MACRYWIYVLGITFLASLGSADARDWYVSPEGSSEQNGSQEQPFVTIQQAMDAVEDGDAVVLLPGIYTGSGNYDIRSSGISVTIRSANPDSWDVTASTVIDPQGAGAVFEFTDGQGQITIEGLTIRNAEKIYPPYIENFGAAIFGRNVDMVIRRCIFLNCRAGGLGGAVYFDASQADVINCIFAGNTAWNGGALMCDGGSSVNLFQSSIVGNAGQFYGGGVSCEFASSLVIRNSILWDNKLIYSLSQQGTQVYAMSESFASIDFCTVDGGADGTYDNTSSLILLGEGIIETDPLFVSYDPQVSPLLWDLRLKSVFGRWSSAAQAWLTDAETSPCIDAGDVISDYSREPWPNGRHVNIGAFGNTEHASLFGNIADLNISGRVDMVDWAKFASVWQDGPVDYEDFDGSQTVDLADLLIMAENWLWVMP